MTDIKNITIRTGGYHPPPWQTNPTVKTNIFVVDFVDFFVYNGGVLDFKKRVMDLTAKYVQHEDGTYSAYIVEVDGINTQ